MSIKYNTNAPSKIDFNLNEIQKINFNSHTLYTAVSPIVYPVKGDLINIDILGSGTPQQYRVLKINDNIAEVLSMSTVSTQKFASSGQTYKNGILDNYLNSTWYNTLSVTAKAAIVDKTFKQDSWYWGGTSGSPTYQGKYGVNNTAYRVSLGNASFGSEITRHIYALSVQDVIDYLEVTPQMTQDNTTLTSENVYIMFWNNTTTHSDGMWFRSANASVPSGTFYVNDNNGSLNSYYSDDIKAVRPALTIDLSMIDFNIIT